MIPARIRVRVDLKRVRKPIHTLGTHPCIQYSLVHTLGTHPRVHTHWCRHSCTYSLVQTFAYTCACTRMPPPLHLVNEVAPHPHLHLTHILVHTSIYTRYMRFVVNSSTRVYAHVTYALMYSYQPFQTAMHTLLTPIRAQRQP